ncbi:SDR family NAD(P)-dependent oxidoreductase [Mesorhizobium sp. CAU 1741]|uniref:SDR family NAD(P)-dependent oxidoreductase n=1 Tax=Mesorhizobium sp. CAU 1741 TaxID=3140366 RepID=UPI00325A6A3F
MELEGRVAFVTGAGSGIGRAVCHRLHELGASVAAVDIKAAVAMETAEALGSRAIALEADVTDEGSVSRAVSAAADQFGRLDIAVNAAGVGVSLRLIDQSVADIDRVLRTNLTGVMICCKYQAREMIALANGGVIVNIVSTNAVQPGEGLSAYCASKAGVAMVTKVGAMELAADNIRVVGVGPGLTQTPMVDRFLSNASVKAEFLDNIPAGRPAWPQDIANVVGFLATDAAAYITGETIYVDGGALTGKYPSLAARSPSSPVEAGA